MSSIHTTTNESESTAPLAGLHVLLCEDCVDQRRLILKILQVFGAEVTLECNGLSAVNTFKKHPNKFDAIVMDFQMPEMDGLVATQKIRGMNYCGIIIAVTGFGTEQLREAWFDAGCDEFLSKPLHPMQLLETICRSSVASAT